MTPRPADAAPPDLTVSYVAYNCADDLLESIASVQDSLKEITAEIVVTDNASADSVVERVRREHPEVKVLEMGWNSGFPKANNRGIWATSGRHVVLLNPDTVVSAGALDLMVEFLDDHPDVAVVGPGLLNTDLTDQGTARSFHSPSAAVFGRRSPITRFFPNNRFSKKFNGRLHKSTDGQPYEVDWVSGACLMIRREVVEDIGALDEEFFMHFEDAEWCYRAKRAGSSVWCVPAARVVHHEGGSRRGWPASQVWHFHHGAYLFWKKSVAPQPWNPLRWAAGIGLLTRAGLVIVQEEILRRIRRPAPQVRIQQAGE